MTWFLSDFVLDDVLLEKPSDSARCPFCGSSELRAGEVREFVAVS